MLLMFKETMTDLEVQKVKGFLASMYISIEKMNEIERNIKQCRSRLGTKGIRYDKEPGSPSGITHDQRLIEMISKIDDLEVAKKIEKKKSRYLFVSFNKANLLEEEKELLDDVYIRRLSYEEIGKNMHCSKSQVYRKITNIYEKIYTIIC